MSDEPSAPSPAPSGSPLEPVGPSGLPPNVAAALAVMIPFVGGVVFLFLERRDRFVRFYSVQSIVLGVFFAVACVIKSLVEMMFHPIPLVGPFMGEVAVFTYDVFALVWIVVYVIAMLKSLSGKIWAIPYVGPMLKKNLLP